MQFKKDHNFEGELQRSAELQTYLRLVATAGAEATRAGAPRRTGYYARSIRATGNTFYSTDPFAHLIEWGSIHNPPYAPLRRAVIGMGLRLGPS